MIFHFGHKVRETFEPNGLIFTIKRVAAMTFLFTERKKYFYI